MPTASPSRARRILMPLIILAVGGAIAVWASQRENDRVREMRQLVTDLCLAAAGDVDLTRRLPVQGRALRQTIATLLETVCAPLRENPQALEVDVASQPLLVSGRQQATTAAHIRIGGTHVLTLNLAESDDRIVIIGYEQPQAR